jgi:hypothetical protein
MAYISNFLVILALTFPKGNFLFRKELPKMEILMADISNSKIILAKNFLFWRELPKMEIC